MLEYFLVLPLVIFALLVLLVAYFKSKNKKLAIIGIIAFISIIIINLILNTICAKQEINLTSKNNLRYYLNTYNLSFIHTPRFMCASRSYRLQKLNDTDNKVKIKIMYSRLNSDGKITFNEAHELSIKTIFLNNLEK